MNESTFQNANEIIGKIEALGHEAYIVGGAVRDLFLQKEIHDVDITTSAPVNIIKSAFPKTIDVAIKHGTVIVQYKGEAFEVTSFRGSSLLADLAMRDFTINAMALTKERVVIDPYLGQVDIKNGSLRAVDHPHNRFIEDPLRILRAIRFVSELSFTIEQQTLEAMHKHIDKINQVAVERVFSEFKKICLGNNVEKAFEIIIHLKIVDKVTCFQGIKHAIKSIDTIKSMCVCKSMTEVWILFLFVSRYHHYKNFLRSWKQPKKVIDEVETIMLRLPILLQNGFTEEDCYFLGIEKAQKAERVRAALLHKQPQIGMVNSLFHQLPIKERKQIKINGFEIIQLLEQDEPRERIGEIIFRVEKAILQKRVENKKETIINWLREEGYIGAK